MAVPFRGPFSDSTLYGTIGDPIPVMRRPVPGPPQQYSLPHGGLMAPQQFAAFDPNLPTYDMDGRPLHFSIPGLQQQPQQLSQGQHQFHQPHQQQQPPQFQPVHQHGVPQAEYDRMLQERDTQLSGLQGKLRNLESIREESETKSNGELESLRRAAAGHTQEKEQSTQRHAADMSAIKRQLQDATRRHEDHTRQHSQLMQTHDSQKAQFSALTLRYNKLHDEHESATSRMRAIEQHSAELASAGAIRETELQWHRENYKQTKGAEERHIQEKRQLQESNIQEKRQLQEQLLQSNASECKRLGDIIASKQRDIAEQEPLILRLREKLMYLEKQLKTSHAENDKLLLNRYGAEQRLKEAAISKPTPQVESAQDQYLRQLKQYAGKRSEFYSESYTKHMALLQIKDSKKSQEQRHQEAVAAATLDIYNFFDPVNRNPALPAAAQQQRATAGPKVMLTRPTTAPPQESREAYNARRQKQYEIILKEKHGQLQHNGVAGDINAISIAYANDWMEIYFYPDNPRPEEIQTHGMIAAKRINLENAKVFHAASIYFKHVPFPAAKTSRDFREYPISREQSLEFYEKILNESRNKFKRHGFEDSFIEQQSRMEADSFHRAEFGRSPSQSVIASTTRHFKINKKR